MKVRFTPEADAGRRVLGPAERSALRASIEKGLAEADRGLAIPADEALRRLRAK